MLARLPCETATARVAVAKRCVYTLLPLLLKRLALLHDRLIKERSYSFAQIFYLDLGLDPFEFKV